MSRIRITSVWGLACAASLLLGAAQAGLVNPAAAERWDTEQVDPLNAAQIYGTAADQLSAAVAADELKQLINTARRESSLPSLEPDPLLARLAQQHANEMAQQRYASHMDLDGNKCEARYNALGGTDHVSENFIYSEIDLPVYLTPQLLSRLQQQWLASELHRRNELDPAHTHLGCGFALVQEEQQTTVVAVVEFGNDYGDYARLPQRLTPGDRLEISGRLDPVRARFVCAGVGCESLPQPRDASYLNSHDPGYRQPELQVLLLPRGDDGQPQESTARQLRAVDYDPASGDFDVALRLSDDSPPGAYYVTVWARRPGWGGDPFCVMTQVVLVGAE
jgi:uncharacterized protein YkwD